MERYSACNIRYLPLPILFAPRGGAGEVRGMPVSLVPSSAGADEGVVWGKHRAEALTDGVSPPCVQRGISPERVTPKLLIPHRCYVFFGSALLGRLLNGSLL